MSRRASSQSGSALVVALLVAFVLGACVDIRAVDLETRVNPNESVDLILALGVAVLDIGPEIDPGVPWTVAHGANPLALALKSGNFGAEDFFDKAWKMLP